MGQTHCIKRSPTLQIRTRMLSGASPLSSSTRDSARVRHRHIHVVVGHPEGLRLPIKTDIKLARMRLGIPQYIADYLIAIDSEGKTLQRSPAAYTASAKKLRKAMPPIQSGARCKSRSCAELNHVESIFRYPTSSAIIS